MTIEEAIQELGTLYVPRDGEQDRLADAQEMAIRSLEAWEKVRAEIQDFYDSQKECLMRRGKDELPADILRCIAMSVSTSCLEIIDKYLQEVST